MHTFRIRRATPPTTKSEGRSAGLPKALELLSEPAGELLAACSFRGRFTLSTVSLTTPDGRSWNVTPNRRVMPTHWTVSVDGSPVVTFRGQHARKILNPLHRTSVVAFDAADSEILRVQDPTPSVAERLISPGPSHWMLVRDGEIIGKLVRLPKPVRKDVGPIRRALMKLAGSDHGLVSLDGQPVLDAPAALALVAIHEELTEPT